MLVSANAKIGVFTTVATHTTLEHATVVSGMPRSVETLMCAVLAHGAHPDAIRQFNAPYLQRLKELRDGSAIARAQGCSSRGILRGSEERDALCRERSLALPFPDRDRRLSA